MKLLEEKSNTKLLALTESSNYLSETDIVAKREKIFIISCNPSKADNFTKHSSLFTLYNGYVDNASKTSP